MVAAEDRPRKALAAVVGPGLSKVVKEVVEALRNLVMAAVVGHQ